MNIKKTIVLASLISAVGIAYAAYSLKSLSDAFEFDIDDEEELDGEV